MGLRYLFFEWDRAGAEREIRRAMELAPNSPDVTQAYCVFLFASGRPEEAVRMMRHAVEKDPLNLVARELIAEWSLAGRHYDDAIQELKAILDMDPQYVRAWQTLSLIYFAMGRWPEYLQALPHMGSFSAADITAQEQAFSAGGKRGLLQAQLRILLRRQAEGKGLGLFSLARVYAHLGESDKAFACLEQDFRERAIQMVYIGNLVQFDPLRSDARFQNLLRRIDELGSQHAARSQP